ncbi:NADH-quinone oxidoreductase subunit B family protein [Hydrogenimonas sp.]
MKLLWLQGISCNGNAHSFLGAEGLAGFLDEIELLHHPLLPSLYTLEEVEEGTLKPDILVVEGAIPKAPLPGAGSAETIRRYAKKATHILCVGNCASFGGIFRLRDRERIAGALFAGEEPGGALEAFKKKVINLPGCPIHPEWLLFTVRMLRQGRSPALDELRRPRELYGYTVHEGCLRNEYFEWKVDSESFGIKEGCLFYKQGCQGPFTHGSCNKILWNGVNSKPRAGTPCLGCTEPDFPASSLFRTHTLMSIPARLPLGVPKRAYLTLTGVAKAFTIPRLSGRKFDED